MRGQIFISYRRATDGWAVDKLHRELVGAFGSKNVFLDRQTIGAGDDWNREIDEAIHSAAAVVVVFSEEWYGTVQDARAPVVTEAGVPAGPAATPGRVRRIDDPTDKLRIELEMAVRYQRPLFPIIVDDSREPRPEDLPESVRAICKRQFLRLDVSGDTESQMTRLIGDIRHATAGSDWVWRLSGQAFWLSLLSLSLVLAWHKLDGDEIFRNGFARVAMALRDRIVEPQSNISVVEMEEAEYRELMGGRTPLDPKLVQILLRRLHQSSARCDRSLPIVLNLDVAPTTEDNEAGDHARMTNELLELASCRPVALACPQAIRRGTAAFYEMRWMNGLRARAQANQRVHLEFGTGMADPEGLRRGHGRSEIGVLAADLAAGRRPFGGHDRPGCVCPSTPKLAAECAERPVEIDWDDRGFAVPLPGSSERRPDRDVALTSRLRPAMAGSWLAADDPAPAGAAADGGRRSLYYNLAEALAGADDLMRSDAVVIGSNRSLMRHAVPGRPRRAFEGVSNTMVQAHLLNGAMNHEPQRGSSGMLLLGLLAGWAVAALMLLAGLELERNDQRFANRGGAYVLFVAGLLGVPLATLVASAHWPASIWWLALVALIALLAAGRAMMSCFEIVLSRGLAWRWPMQLHREYLHGNAKSSALLRLVIFSLEAALIVTCWIWLAV